jgi:very-short-patch-repair endonuclease
MAHEECKLVVEVDGENHSSVRARDERKDRFLEERGWLVLRVSNDEVLEHLDRVLVSITSALTDRRRTYSAAGR